MKELFYHLLGMSAEAPEEWRVIVEPKGERPGIRVPVRYVDFGVRGRGRSVMAESFRSAAAGRRRLERQAEAAEERRRARAVGVIVS